MNKETKENIDEKKHPIEEKIKKSAERLKQKAYPIATILACFLLIDFIASIKLLIIDMSVNGFELSIVVFLVGYSLTLFLICLGLFVILYTEMDKWIRKRMGLKKQ